MAAKPLKRAQPDQHGHARKQQQRRIDSQRNIVLGHLEDEHDGLEKHGDENGRREAREAAPDLAHLAQLALANNLFLEKVFGDIENGDGDHDIAHRRQQALIEKLTRAP